LDASNRSRELEDIRKHDHHELVELLRKVLHDKSLLKTLQATSTPEVAHNFVEAIEQARSRMNTVMFYFSVLRHVYIGVEGNRHRGDAGETAPGRLKGVA
jgi:hypothetical protein